MATLILFNRRRVGENSIVSNYVNSMRTAEDPKDQLFLALTTDGKERVKQYSRMRIRGKKDRTVPVLLNGDAEKCLDRMLSYRDAAGISPTNQRLFAFSLLCGAEYRERLRGTKFRKHFATFCATKEVNDSTITDVGSFMGHSVLIHKEIYRSNPLDRELLKCQNC